MPEESYAVKEYITTIVGVADLQAYLNQRANEGYVLSDIRAVNYAITVSTDGDVSSETIKSLLVIMERGCGI